MANELISNPPRLHRIRLGYLENRDVDCQAGAAAPLYLRRLVVADLAAWHRHCVEAPKDIYPYIDIPVVTIVWSYTGLPPRRWKAASSRSASAP